MKVYAQGCIRNHYSERRKLNMKQSNKICILSLLCLLLTITAHSRFANASVTKASLMQQIQAETREEISRTYYTDFDGDGQKELFAITGDEKDSNQIWFASARQTKCLYKGDFSVYPHSDGTYKGSNGICKVSKKQKILVLELGGWGSGSISACYYVKSGKVHQVKYTGEGLTQLAGKEFFIAPSAFDWDCTEGLWTGHTWKHYYLKWTGTKFREYKGKKISLKTLKKYRGSRRYLKQIQNLGYQVDSIYKRENGIININIHVKTKSGKVCENVNLRKKGNKIKLIVYNPKGKDIVAKSSFGGIYKSKGLDKRLAKWFR